MTDERLMELYSLEDNPEAFSKLYGKYSPIVYGHLSKKLFNRTNVDEIFQDVFVKLHQSRHKYNAKFPFSAWLFTIVRSCMFDYFRKIRSTEVIKDNYETFLKETSIEVNKNDLDDLEDILHKRFIEEWTFEEIANELKISEAGARQRISRALRQLRGKYV